MRRVVFDLVFLAGLALFDYSVARLADLPWGMLCAGIEIAAIGFLGGLAASRGER